MEILERLESFILGLKVENEKYKKEIERLKGKLNGKGKKKKDIHNKKEYNLVYEKLKYLEESVSDLLLTIENLYKRIDQLERKVLFLERRIR